MMESHVAYIMKKTLVTLAGTAMLVSVLMLSVPSTSVAKEVTKSKKERRSLFSELSKKEKEEMTDAVAEDLGNLLGEDGEKIKGRIARGEDIEQIVESHGLSIPEAISLAETKQREALKYEIERKVENGDISTVSAKTLLEKISKRDDIRYLS